MNDFDSIFKDVKNSFASIGVGNQQSAQNQTGAPQQTPPPSAAQPPQQQAVVYPTATATPLTLAQARIKRYRDSYRVAKTLNAFGLLAKIVGLRGGGLVAFISFTSGAGLMNEASRAPFGGGGAGVVGGIIFVGGISLGVLIAAVFFALGVVISALGQNLFAALDTAVHTSPFLTDEQKAEASS